MFPLGSTLNHTSEPLYTISARKFKLNREIIICFACGFLDGMSKVCCRKNHYKKNLDNSSQVFECQSLYAWKSAAVVMLDKKR